jgi:16S rRNA (uracil1498-N3)-methyltransferase
MQIHRFYCGSINQPRTVIAGPEAHHIAAVLRLKSGDTVELFDGAGTLAEAVITDVSSKRVTLNIKESKTYPKPERPRIIIAAAVAKNDRFDWLIAKCTELGIDRITPVIFERSVKQPKNPKILERWNNLTVAAAKQSKRLFLPTIDLPLPLGEAFSKLTVDYSQATLLVGSLSDNAKPLIEIDFDKNDLLAFVGPEGGLTDTEQQLLAEARAVPVRLTDTVLRIETAAIALASILAAKRDALMRKNLL